MDAWTPSLSFFISAQGIDFLHRYSAWAMIAAGLAAFLALFFVDAPYGRYSKGGAWGPLINPKVAWMVRIMCEPYSSLANIPGAV